MVAAALQAKNKGRVAQGQREKPSETQTLPVTWNQSLRDGHVAEPSGTFMVPASCRPQLLWYDTDVSAATPGLLLRASPLRLSIMLWRGR